MTAQEFSPSLPEVAAQQPAELRRAPLWQRPFTWMIVLVGLAFAFLPACGDNVQLRESLSLAAVYITLASSLNIMLGYSGYVNFGNIVFFGLGGYVCLYLVSEWLWPLAAAALAAGVAVSLLALMFGLGILRLRGAFLLWPRSASTKRSKLSSRILSLGAARREFTFRLTFTSRSAGRHKRCGSSTCSSSR
jgi:hypothetical protein